MLFLSVVINPIGCTILELNMISFLQDNKYIDIPPTENDPGRSLHVKSTEEKVVKEHQQLASTDEINNSQRTIRENSDGLEEFERDERRMIASKLLERQG